MKWAELLETSEGCVTAAAQLAAEVERPDGDISLLKVAALTRLIKVAADIHAAKKGAGEKSGSAMESYLREQAEDFPEPDNGGPESQPH